MASKYELTISTNYVPDWTYIEAFRELFQNAIDNEITNPDNKMGFSFIPYDEGSETGIGDVVISNKSSSLDASSLLLGSTTKANDVNTLGKHGEGYKIAFMVLLREGKTVKVCNYGKNETWEARLVKSRRFSGELVPVITVHSKQIWEKYKDNNLSIIVGNVSKSEWEAIKNKNLHLQNNVESIECPNIGRVLTSEKEAGNIYAQGLFICHSDNIRYGYDFVPSAVQLDRDRKLLRDFDISWNTSKMWRVLTGVSDKCCEMAAQLVEDDENDVKYIVSAWSADSNISNLANKLAENFVIRYGVESTPVVSTEDLQDALDCGEKPVIINSTMADVLKISSNNTVKTHKKKTIKEKFEEFMEKIEGKLDDDELEEFRGLIEQL